MTSVYLYGIIRDLGPRELGRIGLPGGREGVYTAGDGGLAGVVSDYDGPFPTDLPRAQLLGQLIIHQQVVEAAMRLQPILPAKFGTVLPGLGSLHQALVHGASQLAEAIESFTDTVECEVAVTWELKDIYREISRGREFDKLRAAMAIATPEEARALQVLAGMAVKEALESKRVDLKRQLCQRLVPLAIDHHFNSEMGDEMVMNVAFLIPSGALHDFQAGLSKLDREFESRLTFRCIGPLPPYSFGTVELCWPDPGQVQSALRLLELDPGASGAAVRAAYRAKASRLHPDVNPLPEARERFQELRKAERLLLSISGANSSDGKRLGDNGQPNPLGNIGPGCLVTVRRAVETDTLRPAAL